MTNYQARSRRNFRLFTRIQRRHRRQTERLTRYYRLPLMVQRVTRRRQRIGRRRRQNNNLRRLISKRPYNHTITTLRQAQRVVLANLNSRTRSLKGRNGPRIIKRVLRPLTYFKRLPDKIYRCFTVNNYNRDQFDRRRPLIQHNLHKHDTVPNSQLGRITSTRRTIATVHILYTQHSKKRQYVGQDHRHFHRVEKHHT